MTPKEFMEKFMYEEPQEGPDLPLINRVYEGLSVVSHKTVFNTDVWEHNGQFFAVKYARSNSGYWSDCEYYDPTVTEVFPYTFTETRYKELL